MEIFRDFLNNFVVQILLGIGVMVFIIMLGNAIADFFSKREKRLDKKFTENLKKEASQDISKMREEIEQLRATLLEHSLSLESNLESLRHRVEHLERKSRELELGER
ncbi:MAG TPA: hypothetical protein VNK96_01575 [Fimbriimonadales bacterium]|nr:hypothetical protein [Fimbriimonadales bacterium]